MNLDSYVKKHTFIFVIMLLFIIIILLYSFVLVGNSDFKDPNIIINNPLRLTFKDSYISVTKSDDKNDVSENLVYINNSTNTKEDYKLYVFTKDNFDYSDLYYNINGGEIKKVNNDGLLDIGEVEENSSISLSIGFVSLSKEDLPEFRFKLR